MQEFNAVLVPVDFSDAAHNAFEYAIGLVSCLEPIVMLLHVMDVSQIDFAVAHELGAREEVVDVMRARAERALADYGPRSGVQVMTIVVEGTPFLEIIKKAEELQADAILMGKFGLRGKIDPCLFGTMAEHVIRGSTRPVIVLPALRR
ncbi:MAG TPA: universal stress protein [Pirellulales bacterium]|nr:universal stress protein [Pirellulales bacterium]